MFGELFSERYSLRPTPEGLMYEDVPKRARVGLYHITELHIADSKMSHIELYHGICLVLRIQWDRRVDNEDRASVAIERLIMECIWWQFYDICEVIWLFENYKRLKENLSTHINSLFRDEQLGFEMREGKVEKVGAGFIDAQIKEARYLLKEPGFKSADELFEKAIKALNARPKPDSENCIKDAVAAVESVGKIIRNDKNVRIDNIIKDAIQKEVIPRLLGEPIIKLYAYRGNEPAIAHGGIEPSKVTEDEAEFVLAITAAIIIYLVKKRSKLE